MNSPTRALFILSFLSVALLYVAGAPFITKVYPSWGPLNTDIFIDGTGFSATQALNSVQVSGYLCDVQSSTTTLIKCWIQDTNIPRPNSLVLTVVSSGVRSNQMTYGLISFGNFIQNNDRYYIQGQFSSIPDKTQIIARSFDGLTTIPVVYENNLSLYLTMTMEMVSKGSFQVIDTTTNAVVTSMTPLYGAFVQDVKFYEASIVFTGFIYTADTTVVTTIQSIDHPCTITARTDTSMTCTPWSNYFNGGTSLPYTLKKVNGISTTSQTIVPAVVATQNSGADLCTLTISTLDLGETNIRVSGLTSTQIIPTSTTPSSPNTMIGFTYPLDAQCGYVFISTDASKSFLRLTSSIYLCPKPNIVSIISKPDASNNYLLTFNGYFLPRDEYGSGLSSMSYLFQYDENPSSSNACSQISTTWVAANSTYTVICQILPITTPISFKLIATTRNYQSSVVLIGYQPTITTVSKTDYGQPGVVTMTGIAFSPIDLLVTIGGSECTVLVVEPDGSQLTCTFAGDVAVVDFSQPLEVVVSIGSTYVDTKSLFYYNRPIPTITQATSTVYGVPGQVTITGLYFYTTNLLVTIGGSSCTSPVSSQGGDSITCQYQSDVQVANINTPLEVSVTADSVKGQNNVFYYRLPTPTITSSTSTLFGTPGQITITGTDFYNLGLIVSIGGSQCKSPLASQDAKTITCLYESDVAVSDINTPLEVSVTTDTINTKKSVFYYIKPTQVSITSSTSTKYGIPGIVTITGNNFINDQLVVKIGGSQCTDAVASQDSKQLTCQFKSDIQVSDIKTALDVFVSIQNRFNATAPVFLYIKPDQSCPNGNNGELCSGHGTCSQQFICNCIKGWVSADCSIADNGGGTIIPDPEVHPNDTSSTIITPGGALFDVGIVLINEIDQDNNVKQSYNITSINWNNITKQDNQHIYTTTLQNNKSTLTVMLSINNLNEIVYYNFAGDIIPILPKSIKYQVELQNYTFSSRLNTMQFIFKSGIAHEGGECVYESSTNTQTTSNNSIRSIFMILNGETLIGTFSDRIVLDNRPSYNQVSKLTDTQVSQYNLNSQSLYIAITTTSFTNNIVVDPNFGVLITSKSDDKDKCKKKFASWKIALIVVLSVVGVALVITTVMLIKKRQIVKQFNAKLKAVNNN